MFVSEGFQDERLVADLARAGFDACGEGVHTALLQIVRRQLAPDLTNRPAATNKTAQALSRTGDRRSSSEVYMYHRQKGAESTA